MAFPCEKPRTAGQTALIFFGCCRKKNCGWLLKGFEIVEYEQLSAQLDFYGLYSTAYFLLRA